MPSRLTDPITSVAGDALRVVSVLEPVQSAGSFSRRHGIYVFAGPCTCRRCGRQGDPRLHRIAGTASGNEGPWRTRKVPAS